MRNGVLKVDPKIGHLFLSPLLSVSFFAFGPFYLFLFAFGPFLYFSFCFRVFSFCFFFLLGLFIFFSFAFGPFYLFLFAFGPFSLFFLTFFLRLFLVAVRPNLKPSGLRVEYSVTILDEFLQLWQNFKSLIIFRGFI